MLECLVKDYYPENIKVQWLKGDEQVESDNEKKLQNTDKQDKTFTLLSQLSISSQYNDKPYTCKATHNSQDFKQEYNICHAKSLTKPSIQLKRNPLREIMREKKVTISCVVEGPDNTVVSWLTVINKKLPVKESKDQSNDFVRNITLNSDEWLNLRSAVCSAKHPCFANENAAFQVDHTKKTPVVVIRRPFVESVQAGSAVLECVVNDLQPGEVCIRFQANNFHISELNCVNWAPSENNWSLTTRFAIPNEHWTKDKTFTCTVYKPFEEWKSNPTGNIFDDPSIELVVVPSVSPSSSKSQNLLCSATGFNPTIKWLSEQSVKTESASAVTMMEDGRMKVYSEILVPQDKWNEGIIYTCQITDGLSGKQLTKRTSICSAKSLTKPSIQLKRNPLREIMREKKVTISCVVEGPDNTVVSWLTVINKKLPVKESKDQSNDFVRNITLNSDEWLNLRSAVCSAKHPCFANENAAFQVDHTKKTPVVVIRRPFVESVQAGSAVLECVVNDLQPGEVCIRFQANNFHISELNCVNWAPSENNWSLTTRFAIPNEHWTKDKTFTCTVYKPFEEWKSNPTGNIFDDPSIELVVVPSVSPSSSKSQNLLCSATGFNPTIKWLSEQSVKTESASAVTMMEDGRMKVYSEILVPQDKWNEGIIYTCQITDGLSGKQLTKRTSICSVTMSSSQWVDIYLLGPSHNHQSSQSIILTCLVVGQNDKFYSIQWKVNGQVSKENVFNEDPKEHNTGTQSKQSMFMVPVQTWNSYARITCEVKHLCSNDTQEKFISKTRDPKQPTVTILRPLDQSGLKNTGLLCLITGFFPSAIFVEWQLNGTLFQTSQFTNSPVVSHSSSSFSMHSALVLNESQWEDGVYSCIVSHESSQTPVIATLENLSASLLPSVPSAHLLHGADELVCLASGFNPPAINITWHSGKTELSKQWETKLAKDLDGKLSIQSHLPLPSSDRAPGEMYTCRITHATGTQLLHINTKSAIFEEAIFMNENKPESLAQDTVEEVWKMACAFLTLFLLSLVYGCSVTLVKVKPQ